MTRRRLTPFAWFAVLALALAPTAPDPARAGWRWFGNPVEDLRQTLRTPVHDGTDLARRQRALAEGVQALRTVVELRDALRLADWRDQDLDEAVARVDRAARNAVAQRFEQGVAYLLEHGDARTRLAAANLLREIDEQEHGVNRQAAVGHDLAPVLASTLKRDDPSLRQSAVLALGRVNADPQVALPALGALLHAPGVADRRAAAEGQLEWVRAMARSVKDGAGLSRLDAPATIARTSCAVLPTACAALEDTDSGVRRLSLAALHEVVAAWADVLSTGGEPTYSSTGAGADDLRPLTEAVRQRLPALLRALRDTDPQARVAAYHLVEDVTAVGLQLQARSGQRVSLPLWASLCQAVPVLSAGLGDPDVRTRRAALDVLELFGPAAVAAAPALTRSLADPDPFVRWAAVRTVGKIGPVDPDRIVPALARLLEASDVQLRLVAITALERYGLAAHDAEPALVRAASHGDAEVRVAALHALEAVGPDPALVLPTLDAALRDPDHRIRQAAIEVLASLDPTLPETADMLTRALSDPDLVVRKRANDALLSHPSQPEIRAVRAP
jgi:HEAT repeat protein